MKKLLNLGVSLVVIACVIGYLDTSGEVQIPNGAASVTMEAKQAPVPEARTIKVCIIKGTDRNLGASIDLNGLDLEDFKKNPLLVVEHRHTITDVVGKILWFERDKQTLYAQLYFFPRPLDYQGEWLPDRCLSLLQQGVLGVSIYADIFKTRSPSIDDLVIFGPKCRIVAEQSSLVEVSVVGIGAFSDAVPSSRLKSK